MDPNHAFSFPHPLPFLVGAWAGEIPRMLDDLLLVSRGFPFRHTSTFAYPVLLPKTNLVISSNETYRGRGKKNNNNNNIRTGHALVTLVNPLFHPGTWIALP